MAIRDPDAAHRLVSAEELWELFAPLVAFLRKLGVPEMDAEDLAQETLWAAFRSRETFRGDAKLSTWAFGIAKRQWLQWKRKQRQLKRSGVEVSLAEDAGPGADGLAVESRSPRPEEAALARERLRAVSEAIPTLPPEMADALLMHVQDGRSYKEIAALFRSDVNHVSSLIYQARQKLRRVDPGRLAGRGVGNG